MSDTRPARTLASETRHAIGILSTAWGQLTTRQRTIIYALAVPTLAIGHMLGTLGSTILYTLVEAIH